MLVKHLHTRLAEAREVPREHVQRRERKTDDYGTVEKTQYSARFSAIHDFT